MVSLAPAAACSAFGRPGLLSVQVAWLQVAQLQVAQLWAERVPGLGLPTVTQQLLLRGACSGGPRPHRSRGAETWGPGHARTPTRAPSLPSARPGPFNNPMRFRLAATPSSFSHCPIRTSALCPSPRASPGAAWSSDSGTRIDKLHGTFSDMSHVIASGCNLSLTRSQRGLPPCQPCSAPGGPGLGQRAATSRPRLPWALGRGGNGRRGGGWRREKMAPATPSWSHAVRVSKGPFILQPCLPTSPKVTEGGGAGAKEVPRPSGDRVCEQVGSGLGAQSPGKRGLNASRAGAELGVEDVGVRPLPRGALA